MASESSTVPAQSQPIGQVIRQTIPTTHQASDVAHAAQQATGIISSAAILTPEVGIFSHGEPLSFLTLALIQFSVVG